MNGRFFPLAGATLAVFCVSDGSAAVLPYSANGNTLHLWHLDEASGAFEDTGFNDAADYDLSNTGGATGRDGTGSGGYGYTAYSGFGSAFSPLLSGDGTYHASIVADGGGATGAAPIVQSSLMGADGAFTWEALIRIDDGDITSERTIISHDGSTTRGANFRIVNGQLSFYSGVSSLAVALPSSGTHAFMSGEWFHAAVAYNGNAGAANNLTFFWTRMSESQTAANLLGTNTLSADISFTANNLLMIGGAARSPYRFESDGIDEVRISSVALGIGDFVFAIPEPTGLALLAAGIVAGLAIRRRR